MRATTGLCSQSSKSAEGADAGNVVECQSDPSVRRFERLDHLVSKIGRCPGIVVSLGDGSRDSTTFMVADGIPQIGAVGPLARCARSPMDSGGSGGLNPVVMALWIISIGPPSDPPGLADG